MKWYLHNMNEKKTYTVILFTQNLPGVLYRIADLFLRRKINIESLTVSELDEAQMSRFTIVVNLDKATIEKLVKQLYRIIEVVKVYEKTDGEIFYLNLILLKISAPSGQARLDIENIARMSHATISFVGHDYLIIQKTGTEEEIHNLFTVLKPFGIKEHVRSGRIAVLKDDINLHLEKSTD